MDRELKERIANTSDDELIRMVEVDYADYRRDAIDLAKSELMSRGVNFHDPTAPSTDKAIDASEEVDLSGYSFEGIQRARQALAQRDMELARAAQLVRARESGELDEEEDSEEEEERDLSRAEEREIACPACGSETRFGMVMSEQALVMVYTDNSERRYVDAYACQKCGRVQLVVDLEQTID